MKKVKHSKSQGIELVFFIFIVLVYLGAILFFFNEYNQKYHDYIKAKEEVFDNSIKDIFGTYEEFSDFIFRSEINRESVLSIIAQASNADDEKKQELRENLYLKLNEVYGVTKEYNFRQLHFHLANGDSFLRFHSPEKYGDNLLDIRESIRIANEEKRYVSGFEEGRIFNGYRYVYPLSYEGKHIGSVEISISMACLIEELYKSDEMRDIGFIISKDIVESTVFKEEQDRYGTSYISEDYLYDSEVFEFIRNGEHSLKLQENTGFINALKDDIKDELERKESFSLAFYYDSNAYIILYHAIEDISGKPVGYIFCIDDSSYLEDLKRDKYILFSLSFFTLGIVILMFFTIRRIQKKIYSLALIDQLTQVYNRASFYEFAKKQVAKRNRNNKKLSIAMIDIDFFKKVNDTFGHSAGDLTLKQLAKIVLGSIRTSDIFARFGGEEFILLLPDTELNMAEIVLERVRENVEKYNFPEVGNITISIGVAEIKLEEEIDAAIKRADIALYEAKTTGRNKVVLAQ